MSRPTRPARLIFLGPLLLALAGTVAGQPAPTTGHWRAENDAAAAELREARRADTVAESHRLAEAALARLDALLASPAPDADSLRRARLDRVVALVAAGRHGDAVDAVAALERDGVPLPAYALSSAGDAHSALLDPQTALARYEAALALAPEDDAAHAGRIFALADLDRLDEAEAILRERIADTALGDAERAADRGRLAMVLAWDDEVDDALVLSAAEVAARPDDGDARTRHADLLLQADRPDAALREYDTVLAAKPDARRARLGRAQALSRAGRWEAARDEYAALATDPAWSPLQRALDYEAADRAAQLAFEHGVGEGEDREIAARDERTEVRLTSARSAGGWRVFAGRRDAYAEYQGRPLDDIRDFVGVSLQRDGWRMRAEADRPRDRFDDGTGWAIDADVRLSDEWSLGVAHSHRAFDLPLRAREVGTTGDRTAAVVRWQPWVRQGFRFAAAHVDYTDGNTSRTLGFSAPSRWALPGTATLWLEPGVYASWQSEQDVPYFSPEHDLSLELAGAIDQRLWREGPYRLAHSLQFGVGHYRQDGFGGTGTGRVGYRLAFSRAPGFELYARLSRGRRVFDGEPEYQTRFEIGGWWSFGWNR